MKGGAKTDHMNYREDTAQQRVASRRKSGHDEMHSCKRNQQHDQVQQTEEAIDGDIRQRTQRYRPLAIPGPYDRSQFLFLTSFIAIL